MKHGPYHDCAMCKIAKSVGMIKKPKDEKGHLCTCGSGKNYENCHGADQASHEGHSHS